MSERRSRSRRSPSHSSVQRHGRIARSCSKSESADDSVSTKRGRHHHHHEHVRKRKHRRHDERESSAGIKKEKLENRREVEQRSRMWTVVESDNEDSSSLNKSDRKSSHGHHSSHAMRRPRSCSSSSVSSSESNSSDGSDDKRSHRKQKRKHSSSRKDKKRHKKNKKKKDKKSKTSNMRSNKRAVNQDEYGKYGILRESDYHTKSVSFQAWLRDVKNISEFHGPKWEAMELFKEYMEDYNTCTLPHEKYYDIERYEMKQYQKQQSKSHAKHEGASAKALGMVNDEERVRRERQAVREKKEQEEFRLVMQLMDKEKIDAMREQERLRSQMQMFYKSGNVEEARRLEQLINKVDEDPRFIH